MVSKVFSDNRDFVFIVFTFISLVQIKELGIGLYIFNCAYLHGRSDCKFWEKNPSLHLIIIREWHKTTYRNTFISIINKYNICHISFMPSFWCFQSSFCITQDKPTKNFSSGFYKKTLNTRIYLIFFLNHKILGSLYWNKKISEKF